MSAQGLTLRGRKMAESIFKDTVLIKRPGAAVTNPETGEVAASLTFVYEGPCKVQQTIAQSSSPTAGGHSFTVQSARLDLPVSVNGIQVGDIAVASFLDTATYPGVMPGDDVYPSAVHELTFRVVELFEKSYATAQRLRVEQVTS